MEINTVELIDKSNFNNMSPSHAESSRCPFINISINDIEYEMLIDSDAEVSIISTKYENQILNYNTNTPTLPLVGVSVHLEVDENPTKTSLILHSHKTVVLTTNLESVEP